LYWKSLVLVDIGFCLFVKVLLQSSLLEFGMRTDSRTPGLQQMYNSFLTWGGFHSMWSPPHVRGLLYICCKPGVFLSFFIWNIFASLKSFTYASHDLKFYRVLLLLGSCLFLLKFYVVLSLYSTLEDLLTFLKSSTPHDLIGCVWKAFLI